MTRVLPWLAGIALVVAVGIATAAVAAQGRFTLGVEAVAVDVLVTRAGRPVTDLTAADFMVRDNGVLQEIESVSVEDLPVTLVLVLDTSGSLKGEALEELKVAARAAIDALRPEDHGALMTFSQQVRLLTAPAASPDDIREKLEAVEATGETALYDAMFAALSLRSRERSRTLVLLFSDGNDTVSWLNPRDVLRAAQQSDVVTYAVTLDNAVRIDSLADQRRQTRERRWFTVEPRLFGSYFVSLLAEQTGGSVLVVEDSTRLRDAFIRVVNEYKSRYLLWYTARGVERGGWHEIKVTLNGKPGVVQARRGYRR